MTTPIRSSPVPSDFPGPFELETPGSVPTVQPLVAAPHPTPQDKPPATSGGISRASPWPDASGPGRSSRAERAALVSGASVNVPSLPGREASAGTAQGEALALARILGHVIAALEPLLQEPPHSAAGRRPWRAVPEAVLARARDELVQAQAELQPLKGGGSAQLSVEGRASAAQQRADPQRSDHFGG